MVAVSIAADYDSADLGSITVEIAWILISIFGIYSNVKRRNAHE